MITVATCFWEANRHSAPSSRCYTPEWVNRLYRGFKRNLTVPFRFVVLTDKEYQFTRGVEQELLSTEEPTWASMIEPFRIDGPLIVVGLDTIVRSNIDHMARWCETAKTIALPKSPGKPYACNGVALVPQGQTRIYTDWAGENDMEWLRTFPHVFTDDLWPGQIESYKCYVRPKGTRQTRIVYFHGSPKMQDLVETEWVKRHWR
jgi:hypothetical protein